MYRGSDEVVQPDMMSSAIASLQAVYISLPLRCTHAWYSVVSHPNSFDSCMGNCVSYWQLVKAVTLAI